MRCRYPGGIYTAWDERLLYWGRNRRTGERVGYVHGVHSAPVLSNSSQLDQSALQSCASSGCAHHQAPRTVPCVALAPFSSCLSDSSLSLSFPMLPTEAVTQCSVCDFSEYFRFRLLCGFNKSFPTDLPSSSSLPSMLQLESLSEN